ncbi:TonB-dependent receptor [Polaromonas sp. P1(28)-8]|nr:TonB-dependent receptor [Polaromonas sp. P1(28)-8]
MSYRLGIGTADEFLASLYYLDNNNGINYGLPWIRPNASSPASDTTILPVDPKNYYGAASDYNAGSATMATLGHTHRFSSDSELKTQLRVGKFEARPARQHHPSWRSGTATRRRGCHSGQLRPEHRIDARHPAQDPEPGYRESAKRLQHQVCCFGCATRVADRCRLFPGKKSVYAARTAAQGGVNLTKPNTLAGTPDDGASILESRRVLRTSSDFSSDGVGVYAQDLIQIAPHWKLLAGLRYDHMKGNYNTFSIPAAAAGPVTTTSYSQSIGEWSKRAGVLYQPNPLHSYHVSYGTSFNTSGDTYSYSAATVNTPPESSRNFEIGAKLDTADKRFTTRLAVFHSTKLHERNTDPLLNIAVLSGKRHAAGAEIDITGRLTPQWEIYGSYMWMPSARIDIGAEGAEGRGSRPSLTPRHSGTVWTTYQVTPKVRMGGGLNFRGKQTPNRNPGWEVPSFVTADLMAEYAFSDQITVKANLSNVSNKLYADALYSGHYISGAGRIFQVTGTVKF